MTEGMRPGNLKQEVMKVTKKSVMSIADIARKGDGKNTVSSHVPEVRLKAVTNAERQRLRIPSYQYILP